MTLAAVQEDTRPWLTVETLLYVGLVGLALALRLWGLGYQPLSNAEAHDALLAFRFLRGEAAPASAIPASPASPLLFSLTSLAFLLFGASDTTARLAPALAGSLLVLTPAYLRRGLGPLPALGMAALMALSPTLIAASRAADAAILAALAVMVLLGSLLEYGATGDRRHLYVAGVAAGAGLACGPRAITALLIMGLAAGLWRLLDAPGFSAWAGRVRSATSSGLPLAGLAAIAAGTLIVGSSALLLYRSGLAAAAQAIPAWAAGWSLALSSRGWLHLPAVLGVYEPLVLFLGVAGLVHLARRWSEKDRLAWALAAWGLAALAVGLAYPGRASEDAVWIVIPLTGLAGVFLVELLGGDWSELDVPAVAIHAALVVLLLTYAALNLAAYGQASRTLSGAAAANLGLGAVALVLVALISLLFGVGWSASGAVRGLILGVAVALLFASASAAARLIRWGEQPEMAAELWNAGPPAPLTGLRLMQATLEEVSDRAVGAPEDLEVVVDGPPTGDLAWALRDFSAAVYTEALAATVASPAVIAPADQATPELGSAYVGQSFAIRGRLDASAWGPLDWLSWLAFRGAPTQTEAVVLWVRSDVQFKESRGDVNR